jgi:hypothetical protein
MLGGSRTKPGARGLLPRSWRGAVATSLAALALATACGKSDGVGLSRNDDVTVPDVPVPEANGPRLGAVAHTTPVRKAPEQGAPIIGYLHAGASVARAEQAYSTEDCAGGWFPIRPRGFVCVNEGATLDLRHPTLTTMSIQPSLDLPLPYAYARTLKDAPVYGVNVEKDSSISLVGTLPDQSGAAIVGSWEASDEKGQAHNLAMLTDGRFVDRESLQQAEPSQLVGVELTEKVNLPVAFVVKHGIASWDLEGATHKREKQLEPHDVLMLTGRFRTTRDEKFWELPDGSWVRNRDVTVAYKREQLPTFATPGRHWIDISIISGTVVAYLGDQPVYATLASVGVDRLSEEPGAKVTQRGEFAVVSKHVTALNANAAGFANKVEMHDVPWVLEMASGQLLHGAYWHRRFGVEHGPGNVQLSPADARWLWQWSTPALPEGWHALTGLEQNEASTIINIRK